MAGSWEHIDNEGRFTMALIDNMGDAAEALEQCHAMITWLAVTLAVARGGTAQGYITQAANADYASRRTRHGGLAARVASHGDDDTLTLPAPATAGHECATFRGGLTDAENWLHAQYAQGWRLHTFAVYGGGAPQGLVIMERAS
jgi:hypothetical protein